MLGNGGHAEIVSLAPGRDDEVVVLHGAFRSHDLLGCKVHTADLGQPEPGLGPAAGHGPEGIGDGLLLQGRGGHRVEERLEEMVVVPVEHDHLHPLTRQLPRGPDAAKTHSDNNDTFHEIRLLLLT